MQFTDGCACWMAKESGVCPTKSAGEAFSRPNSNNRRTS